MRLLRLVVLILWLVPVAAAAPPLAPPDRLPTSPAEIAAFVQETKEWDEWREGVRGQIRPAQIKFNTAWNALHNGPFQAAGGKQDRAYLALLGQCETLESQCLDKRTAARVSANANERQALEIEVRRLQGKRDAALAAMRDFVVQYCLKLPEAKQAAAGVQALQREAIALERTAQDAWNHVLWPRHAIGKSYFREAPGASFTKTRDFKLPLPSDAQHRQQAFAQRNDPAELEALAHRLFRALDETAPGVGPAFELYQQGKYAEALTAFRDYFLHKLAHLEQYGIPPEAIITDNFSPLSPYKFPLQWADDAARGIATQAHSAVSRDELLKINVGPPGTVNWAHVSPEPRTRDNVPVALHYMRALHPLGKNDPPNGLLCWLIDAYQTTGEVRYLHRWAEYTDDWALNLQRDLNAVPAQQLAPGEYKPTLHLAWNLRYYDALIPRRLTNFLTQWRAIVLTHPEAARELPAPTLARVVLVAMEEYVSPSILVARTTRFNWNHMGLSFNVRNSLLLSEFKTGQWLGRETVRALQNHALFSILPDGGYVEYSDEGHQSTWREYCGESLRLLRAARPAWFDEHLETDLADSLDQSGRFWLRHLKPDGLRHRDKSRDARGSYVGQVLTPYSRVSLDAQLPDLVAQDEPARMLNTVFGVGNSQLPRHLSDVSPYQGEFVLRGGWGKQDPFFYMHAGRIPNSNSNEDATGFKLHHGGHHLMTGQPVYVDGRSQNMHVHHVDNIGGKTEFLTHSDGLPIKGRWHTSAYFDLAEGIYEGAYEDRHGRPYWSVFQTGGFDMRRRMRSFGLPPVTDVERHTRQVFFVRDPICWIIVDRMATKAQHTYEFPYELLTPVDKVDWLRRAANPIPKMEQRVTIDAANNAVRTDNPGFPRITLHHFGGDSLKIAFDPKSHDLTTKDSGEIRDAEQEWRQSREDLRDWMAFVRRVMVTWQGQGNQVLVTLITTTPADQPDAWRVTGQGESFTATAPDGAIVRLMASAEASAMQVGNVTTEASTLLLVEPKHGPGRGIVLDAKNLSIAGKPLALQPGTSAEFALGPTPALARAIYPPIQPVTFEPQANKFTESVEVKLSSPTTGVAIHYTLDGSEPTLASLKYEKPLRLTASTVVRAIAVRPGAGELHWPLDPGYATLPTRAVFERVPLAPAVKTAPLHPGLTWEYATGQAFALVATSEFVPPEKSGVTERLFDVSLHAGVSAFTVRYQGYLEVPTDGVYTFHAPREYVVPDIDPGYDLRVMVDGEEWWPVMRRHALGTWSKALARGPHKFTVIYTDTRTKPFKHETWRNWPNPAAIWPGTVPSLEVSGPGLNRQPVPPQWLRRD